MKTSVFFRNMGIGAALLALGMVAAVGLFGMPGEELGFGAWVAALIVSKVVGVVAALGFWVLLRYWLGLGIEH